jgi:hypothetical protein
MVRKQYVSVMQAEALYFHLGSIPANQPIRIEGFVKLPGWPVTGHSLHHHSPSGSLQPVTQGGSREREGAGENLKSWQPVQPAITVSGFQVPGAIRQRQAVRETSTCSRMPPHPTPTRGRSRQFGPVRSVRSRNSMSSIKFSLKEAPRVRKGFGPGSVEVGQQTGRQKSVQDSSTFCCWFNVAVFLISLGPRFESWRAHHLSLKS